MAVEEIPPSFATQNPPPFTREADRDPTYGETVSAVVTAARMAEPFSVVRGLPYFTGLPFCRNR